MDIDIPSSLQQPILSDDDDNDNDGEDDKVEHLDDIARSDDGNAVVNQEQPSSFQSPVLTTSPTNNHHAVESPKRKAQQQKKLQAIQNTNLLAREFETEAQQALLAAMEDNGNNATRNLFPNPSDKRDTVVEQLLREHEKYPVIATANNLPVSVLGDHKKTRNDQKDLKRGGHESTCTTFETSLESCSSKEEVKIEDKGDRAGDEAEAGGNTKRGVVHATGNSSVYLPIQGTSKFGLAVEKCGTEWGAFKQAFRPQSETLWKYFKSALLLWMISSLVIAVVSIYVTTATRGSSSRWMIFNGCRLPVIFSLARYVCRNSRKIKLTFRVLFL
jgi:hypothetical protein